MIELLNVTKTYEGRVQAVFDFSLSVKEGQLAVLLGESGCGKTSILKMVNRLVEPTAGRILIEGQSNSTLDPVYLRRRIGYVFQGIGLFPHMTVAENIAVTLQLRDWKDDDIYRRVDEVLELVGLAPAEYRRRMPAQLSGGQQQRVGIARALAPRPKLMLLDEPFGALDPLSRAALQIELRQIQRKLGLTALLVTHDMTEALLLADVICVMAAGRAVQTGTPRELLRNPANDYVRRLMETPKLQADQLESLAGGIL